MLKPDALGSPWLL